MRKLMTRAELIKKIETENAFIKGVEAGGCFHPCVDYLPEYYAELEQLEHELEEMDE